MDALSLTVRWLCPATCFQDIRHLISQSSIAQTHQQLRSLRVNQVGEELSKASGVAYLLGADEQDSQCLFRIIGCQMVCEQGGEYLRLK